MIPNEILLKAISWTLVHSIWQGFILALLAGLVILATRKSSARMRYNLLSGLFIVFLIGIGFTLNYEFQNEQLEGTAAINLPLSNLNFQADALSNTPYQINLAGKITSYLNENAALIVMIWFIIFSIKCLNVFKGLRHIYRVRNYKIHSPSQYWIDRLSALGNKVGIRRKIILVESELVKIPSVTGFLKPMILIPVGLLASLPTEQVEAILLHELAHIKRKDYLINLLQQLCETLFFFNPGVLWLSQLLKDERENCCDDIAVGITGSKTKFVHALVSFEEYNHDTNQLVLGFGRSKNQLLKRAKRIIYNNNQSLNTIEKALLSISLLVIMCLVIACSNKKEELVISNELPKNYGQPVGVCTPETQANLDSSQIVADIQYKKDSIQQEIADAQYKNANMQYIKDSIQGEIAAAQYKKDNIEFKKADDQYKNQNSSDKKADSKYKEELKNKALREEQVAKAKRNARKQTAWSKIKNYIEDKTSTTYEKRSTEENNGHKITVTTGIAATSHIQADIRTDVMTDGIINMLINENVIANTNNLSYRLSQTDLVVNGIVQPEDVHRKIKMKFLKPNMKATYYNYEVTN